MRTGLRAGWIRRRWWIPVLAVGVATTVGGAVAASHPGSYTATMVFVVPSTQSTGISPDGAQRLASTYAALILDDDLIAQAIGGEVKREPADVKRRVTAVNPVNTALVRVTYAGRSRAEALTAVQALKIALTSSQPASPAVRPHSIVTVQDVARVTAPSSSTTSYMLAAVFGLCAAAVLVIALERSDIRVDSTVILEEHVPDIPILGTVAPVGRRSDIPVLNHPFTPAAEGFQSIRIALERLGLGSEIETIVVMSADKQEGKTMFAANLGIALARRGQMVLLVSGDMRRPGLEKLFNVTPAVGLADLLDNEASEPLRALFSITPDLWLLPAGRPSGNPAELLEPNKIREVLKPIRFGNPVVIIDTPPALLRPWINLASCRSIPPQFVAQPPETRIPRRQGKPCTDSLDAADRTSVVARTLRTGQGWRPRADQAVSSLVGGGTPRRVMVSVSASPSGRERAVPGASGPGSGPAPPARPRRAAGRRGGGPCAASW